MPTTIAEYRQREYKEASKEEFNVGSLVSDYRTIGNCAVQIDTEPNETLAKLKTEALVDAIKKVQAHRFGLPERLRFVLSAHERVRCVAFMVEGTPVVYLGPKIVQRNPAVAKPPGLVGGVGQHGERGVANQAREAAWFSGEKDQAVATIVHELGHVLHEQEGGQKFWDNHDNAKMSGDLQKAAIKVSHYASKAPLEFVAEVFAGRVLGKKYTSDVVEEYRKLGGPETRGFF